MCRFLLQKKYALNALDFVGFITQHFPRKIPPNIALKTSHPPSLSENLIIRHKFSPFLSSVTLKTE